jgi:hypothetical protein
MLKGQEMEMTGTPTAHTGKEQPVHFRVVYFGRTPAPAELLTPSDEFFVTVEYVKTNRRTHWGLSRERRQLYGPAIEEAYDSADLYWADMKAPPFPKNLEFNALDQILNAVRDKQIVTAVADPE